MTPSRRFPIRLHIATAFILLLAVVGLAMAWLGYQRSADMLKDSTTELARRAAHEAAVELERILAPARTGVGMLAANAHFGVASLEDHIQSVPVYVEALKAASAVVAFYFGDPQGNYFLVRRLLDVDDASTFQAPAGTAYLAQVIDRRQAPAHAFYIHYDAGLREIGRVDVPGALDFDPRQRPWYRLASRHGGSILTAPYTFFTSGKTGISLASRVKDGSSVFGADLRLETLSVMLARQRMTPGAHLFLLDAEQRLLAADAMSSGPDPILNALLARQTRHDARSAEAADLQRVDIQGSGWFLEMLRLPMVDDQMTYLGVAIPESEMLAGAQRIRSQLLWLTLGLLLLAFPAAFWLARRIARPLSELVRDTEAIRRFDLESPIRVESVILEVDELAQTLSHTKTTLARFLDLVARLTNEADFNRLMPELLRATSETVGADGGLLYMLDAEHVPRPVAGQWDQDELDLEIGAEGGDAFDCRAALAQGRTLTFQASANECARFGLPAAHAVSVPLFNRDRRAIGILVLLGRQAMDPARLRFVEALSGFAAVALETRELIATQKALFESFIRVMAGAIDAKSPYTGGHCARVPEAVKLLAEAVCAQTEGTYADFSMSAEDWEALHIASWLHDCGKVTTPEYVVDKATKLETLYDRIHEVRMRFEVLKRDAEIGCLRAIVAGAEPLAAEAERDAALSALDDEFAFIAECNLGGEFMAPDKVARLKQIAERTWRRTLDDSLGISIEERRRRGDAAPVTLPVDEPLLRDRPEHRFERAAGEKYGPGNPWGFSMKVPELLYDRGELKNLLIARGTLGDEERFKINEHIIQTIIMLTALPFPRHLVNVPEIAGGHHERMDGKGYPKCLTAEQMSPLARMMAIADVFEALTACDRPYKSAKTVSQSLGIMRRMAEEGHIDPELLRIFITSGACTKYAERFLARTQCDITDYAALAG